MASEPKRVTLVIELEIDGDPSDAFDVVDGLLDAGFLQDAINDHDRDAGPLHVVSAVAVLKADPI